MRGKLKPLAGIVRAAADTGRRETQLAGFLTRKRDQVTYGFHTEAGWHDEDERRAGKLRDTAKVLDRIIGQLVIECRTACKHRRRNE